MKKWISLLLAGVLVSAFMVGCKKDEEGGNATPPTATKGEGKMDATPPAGDNKMGGDTKAPEGDKMGGDTKAPEGDKGAPAAPPATGTK